MNPGDGIITTYILKENIRKLGVMQVSIIILPNMHKNYINRKFYMYKGLMPSYKKYRDQPLIYIQRIQIQGEKRQDAQLHFFEKIYGCAGSSLLHMSFLQLQQVMATLRYRAQASHCSGFFCCRAQTPGTQASLLAASGPRSCGLWAFEHRLSGCGTWPQLLCGMWNCPRPGIKPTSPDWQVVS